MHTSVDFERHLLRLFYGWLFFIPILMVFKLYNVDFHVSDYFFRLEGGHWLLKDNVITKSIFHDDGRIFSELMGTALIGFTALAYLKKSLIPWRRPLLYLIAAVTASTVTVNLIKSAVSMDCPWNLMRYGGDLPFIGLFETRPAGMPDTACFPAGHASAGYAWMALYFCLAVRAPAWKSLGLAIGLGMGLVFGVDQQLRGAHFLSHDLYTLMICWSCSTLLAWLMLRKISFDLELSKPHAAVVVQRASHPVLYVKEEGV